MAMFEALFVNNNEAVLNVETVANWDMIADNFSYEQTACAVHLYGAYLGLSLINETSFTLLSPHDLEPCQILRSSNLSYHWFESKKNLWLKDH